MRKLRTALLLTLGGICVVVGLVGIVIPILPTTPLLLLAAFCFARSSDRALQWLLHNRWFGGYIRNYREGRGMTMPNKVVTLALLWLTIGMSSFFLVESIWVRGILVVVASGVTIHLSQIKTYRPTEN